ncbi:hypothetical protein F3Y22_tig00112738pilonHSYRG01227 [Hibiscus syriacus]|uniref:Integrase catalytic domain-containing protein n=1 Tax=Hibiscus syriacus TaxID=106335 RepID=A0A6A2Y6W3_HIBSY|nr:hypothetical protein F3Y22_tig00112738pilonHSYRG01227 [Hibiscus syriacus]
MEDASSSSILARNAVTNVRFVVEIFDGTGHFGMWQSEVLDALFQQGLDIAIEGEKPDDVDEKEWKRINRMHVALEEKFLKKSGQNKLYMKKRLFRFNYVSGTTMNDHITSFNQLVSDLMNMDVTFEDEDLALMLMGSLPDEFEYLETTLLHGKVDVSLSEVTVALYSYELRKKDKQENTSVEAEALVVRGHSKSQNKGSRGRSKSKSRLSKDECAFCREKGHWKKECPRLKNKGKPERGKVVSESNVVEYDGDSDFAFAATPSTSCSSSWLLDSACSHHMTPNREWFFDFKELKGRIVYTANNSPIDTLGIGSIRLRNQDGSIRTLTGVHYVPDLMRNLISVGTLESKGLEVRAKDGIMRIISGALVIMKGIRKRNNVYYFLGSTIVGTAAVAASTDEQESEATRLWHMRLGHVGEKSLKLLIDQGLLKGARSCKLAFCEHCIKGKKTRVKFGTAIHDTKGILDYVHSDVWGPSKTTSLGGTHYYVTFVDDFSRRVWVYPMKTKDEVLGFFLKWKKMMETQTGRKIKRLRTDNGGEYKNDPFLKVCEEEGIVRHFTIRGTPQQNGVAERMNRTLMEKVRCMLSNAGLGKEFWAEALVYACHLINHLPSTTIGGKTPLEKWFGVPATDYDSLHVFGSTTYYHVKESKLDPRAKKVIFMGITSGVKGYRLWCPETKKIIFSRDVTFDESTMLRKVTSEKLEQTDGTPKKVEFEGSKFVSTSKENDIDSPMVEEESDEEEVQTQEPPQQHESIALRKGKKTIRQPAHYVDMVTFASPIAIDDVPATFNEAVKSSEHKKWRIAMNEEMQSLQKNQTWKLASLPKGKKAIGCKWVYAKKDGFPDKNNIRYKARLVAKGYAQTEGVDYNEVFSPVVKHSSIRILLALVVQLDLELVQMDVKTAFLHGDLDEEIYTTQPDGFKVAEKEEMKYTRSKYDNCVYLCELEDGSYIYLLLYVDDMLIASRSQTEIAKLKTQLNREFEMKDLGEAKKILGMEISRDKKLGRLCLSQKEYLRKVLKRFGINEMSKPVSTPLAPHFKLGASMSPKDDAEREYMSKVPYASAVGSLMYAMVCTRSDISQAIGVVSRYMHDPGKEHWQAVKWILWYILNTVDVGLVFQQEKQDGQCVVGYCDSDYAGDLDKRRSTTGYVFTFAKAPVSWKSTLQSTVALSTTEAEYMAVTEAVKEAIWLQGLLGELGMEQKHIKVHCDSQSAIHLAKNQVYHARTKHIDVRYHFVREILEESGVIIQKIRTTENPADMLTKVPMLKLLDICNNILSGNVPPALKRLNVGFQYENNLGLCGVGFPSLKDCAESIAAPFSFTWFRRRKQKIESAFNTSDSRLSTDQVKEDVFENLTFNLEEVERGTRCFSEMNFLGKSNYSAIYTGSLRDSSAVVVKCIAKTSCKSDDSEFLQGLKYLDVKQGRGKVLEWSTRISIIFGNSKDDIVFSTLKTSAAMGYREYTTTGRFTEKSDVYAFGMIVFQVLSGKRKITQLIIHAAETCKVEDRLDMNLDGKYSDSEAMKLGDVVRGSIDFSKRILSLAEKSFGQTVVVRPDEPWTVFGHYLTVEPWTPDFSSSDPFPKSVMAWIRLFRLPFTFYKRSIITEIAECIAASNCQKSDPTPTRTDGEVFQVSRFNQIFDLESEGVPD